MSNDGSHAPRVRALQRWMQAVITHADGVSAGASSPDASMALGSETEVAAVMSALPQLTATESLGVYAGMYAERLRGAVAADYPALAHALGAEQFDDLVRRFTARHPSRWKTLNAYGRDFSDWLRSSTLTCAEFAADLARLERTIVDVRIRPDAEVLQLDALLAVARSQWPELSLELVPALELLACTHPVERYYRAWRRDEDPVIPGPGSSFVAVYRHALAVWRVELCLEQYTLLAELAAGRKLGEAIEVTATSEGADPERLARDLGGWFEEWAREGFFRALPDPG